MGEKNSMNKETIMRLKATFAAIANLWLKNGEPPIVKHVHNILQKCGVVGPSALTMARVIEKLIERGWLAPRPYGKKLSRYVPTLHGFMASFLLPDLDENVEQCLAEQGIEVKAVDQVGLALMLLLDGAYVLPLDDDLKILMGAVKEHKAADEVARHVIEKAVQNIPRFICFLVNAHLAGAIQLFATLIRTEIDALNALAILEEVKKILQKIGETCKDVAPEIYKAVLGNTKTEHTHSAESSEKRIKLSEFLDTDADT